MRTAVCVMMCLAVTTANARNLTVLLDYEQPESRIAEQALARELKGILANAQLQVEVRLKSEVTEHQEFPALVVFHMQGQCSMKPLPVAAVSDERGPLAMTYASDGAPLPFGEVKCDRVRESVNRHSLWSNPEQHEREYGIALGRVMAHEIYHMLAHSMAHTRTGVTKPALSAEELSSGKLMLSRDAQRKLAMAN